MTSRYQELVQLCWGMRPEKILEIGTWNGLRAKQMCEVGAEYVGFDLFEDATDETDETEKNVKPHHTVGSVLRMLEEAGVAATLVKGNTRETLPAYFERWDTAPFDFAFIDGGHSVETIRSDWFHVKQMMRPGGVVVFDDYYEDFEGTDRWGCNEIVKDLEHFFLERLDPVVGGGQVRLVVVPV